ncbi:MAG: hypothetical protein JWM58_3856 [Rhizobium sp.]|nr:hypothetical protein [Rhizobium sp.]
MATMSKILSGKNTDAPSIEDLEDQITELRREIASLTKNIAAFGSSKVDDYKSSLDQLASDAVSASLNAFSTAKSEALSLEEGFEDQVRARPLQAIGIAVGVGFLAALLTRR